MQILERIERLRARTGMAQTRVGREAINDPRLVSDLHNGRRLQGATVRRIEAWLAAQETAR
jgi:hypothetical protein